MEKEVSSLALAYLGDAVMEIHIRSHVISTGKAKIDQLHRHAVKYVCAKSQRIIYDNIQGFLTEDELYIMKRGRNAKKNVPKNVEMADYRKSTGVEALLGYLHLLGKEDRIKEIIDYIILTIEGSEKIEDRKG